MDVITKTINIELGNDDARFPSEHLIALPPEFKVKPANTVVLAEKIPVILAVYKPYKQVGEKRMIYIFSGIRLYE